MGAFFGVEFIIGLFLSGEIFMFLRVSKILFI